MDDSSTPQENRPLRVTLVRRLTARIQSRLRGLHANQSGAIALLVLAAILITMMLGLVLYDTTPAARQKLEVQTAADTAAWSQSSTDARTMNMIAFANVGKRIIVGQAHYYASLIKAYVTLLALAVVALVICLILDAIPFTACGMSGQLAGDVANIANIIGNEASDIASFYDEIMERSNEDLEAIDNYQVYFMDYTPWWSWGEGWRRGVRNGAYTSGWPVPATLDAVSGLNFSGIGFSDLEDELPLERADDLKQMCIRSYNPDLGFHVADYLYHTLVDCSDCTDKVSQQALLTSSMEGIIAVAGGLAAGYYAAGCETGAGEVGSYFSDDYARPWELTDPGSFGNNEAEWYRRTSNLVFAYRPGRDLSGFGREKYGYLSPDYTSNLDFLYEADGYFGVARSEFSYQNGDPDMWHPSWTTRMRPVALPGEWAAYSGDYRMVSAFVDTTPYLYTSALAGDLVGDFAGGHLGDADVAQIGADLLKAGIAFEAMNDDLVDGVAR